MATPSKPTVGYKYEFLDQVPENYLCKQCENVARDAVLTACCIVTMCEACAQQTKLAKKPCSSCNKELENHISYKKIQDEIQALHISCTQKEQGCTWTEKLQEIDAHLQHDCVYVEFECKMCEQKVQKRNKNDHETERCPGREFSCKYCNFKDTYKIVTDQHYEVCSYYILDCPNRCGATFERGELEDHVKMCRLEKVKCEFSFAGCDDEFIRDKQQEHMELNTQKHLTLMAAATARISQEQTVLDQKLQQRDQANDEKFRDLLHTVDLIQEQQIVYEQNILQLNVERQKLESQLKLSKQRSARYECLCIISVTVLIIVLILQVYFDQGQTTENEMTIQTEHLNQMFKNQIQATKNEILLEINKKISKQYRKNKKTLEALKNKTSEEINKLDEELKAHLRDKQQEKGKGWIW